MPFGCGHDVREVGRIRGAAVTNRKLVLAVVVAGALTMPAFADDQGRRVAILFSLLAVALNVVGAPMLSAHMASMDHGSPSSMSGMEHCKGHMSTGNSDRDTSPANGHLACCKSGVCSCGCLHAAAISVLAISTHTTAPDSAPAEPIRAVAAHTVEDHLRPPIT